MVDPTTVSDGFGRYRRWVSEGRVQTRTFQHFVPFSADIKTAGVSKRGPGSRLYQEKATLKIFSRDTVFLSGAH